MGLEIKINYEIELHQEQSPNILKFAKEQSLSKNYLKIPNKNRKTLKDCEIHKQDIHQGTGHMMISIYIGC